MRMNLPKLSSPPTRRPARRAAQGFTLIAILVMMVVLAFISLAAVSTSIVQERMAGNARDRNVALQAGEAALRDAERHIETTLNADSGFSDACTNGLCVPPSMTLPASSVSAPKWTSIDWATQSRAYGSATGAVSLKGPDSVALSSQPRYFIEMLPSLPPEVGESACLGCTSVTTTRARAYRITVQAFGVRDSTTVMLQSVYIKQ